jgi:hypothetical protein
MSRMRKYAVVLLAAVALLSVKAALSAEGPVDRSTAGRDLWDGGGPAGNGLIGEVALQDPEDPGPPGPPRVGDNDRSSPPRHKEPGPPDDHRRMIKRTTRNEEGQIGRAHV